LKKPIYRFLALPEYREHVVKGSLTDCNRHDKVIAHRTAMSSNKRYSSLPTQIAIAASLRQSVADGVGTQDDAREYQLILNVLRETFRTCTSCRPRTHEVWKSNNGLSKSVTHTLGHGTRTADDMSFVRSFAGFMS
jgi:hypothetical protein